MSIRKKIMLGFLCLGVMLAFSSMISIFQLGRLSRNTQNLLDSSIKSMSLSRSMLDATQEQNTSLLRIVVIGQHKLDSSFFSARSNFEAALDSASAIITNPASLYPIRAAANDYDMLVNDFFTTPGEKDVEWFMGMYGSSYLALTNSIKDYMVASQENLLNRAESLERNAYRAIMPGIITLFVAIMIVIIFAFLMDIYYIRPVQRMTRGLDNLLRHRIPYNVEVSGNDEIAHINGQIEELAALARNRMNE